MAYAPTSTAARCVRFVVGAFQHDPHSPTPPPADLGNVLLPKLFRRVAEWSVNKRARSPRRRSAVAGRLACGEMVTSAFRTFLRTKSSDVCFDTAQFLEQGPTASVPMHLADLIDASGMFTRWPEEVVFQEAASTLVGPGGAPVQW